MFSFEETPRKFIVGIISLRGDFTKQNKQNKTKQNKTKQNKNKTTHAEITCSWSAISQCGEPKRKLPKIY